MGKKAKILVAGAVLVLLAIIAALVIYIVRMGEKEDIADSGSVYVVDENNYQQIMEEASAKVEAGYVETYMNMEWTFEDGASVTEDAILGNSPNNDMSVRYEVSLKETGEVIFKTGVLPPGTSLPPFKLDKDLDAGVYEGSCRAYLLEEKEDGTYQDYSKTSFNITITVLN